MPSLTKDELQKSLELYEKKAGRAYDITLYQTENIQPGKAIYAVNHFHHFDPIFFLYSLAKEKGIMSHHMVKPSLHKFPFIRKYIKYFKTISTPREKMGETLTWEDYFRMKEEVNNYLDIDEPLSFSFSGTITHNVSFSEEDLEKEITLAKHNSGMISLAKHDKDLCIVPVAVDTFEAFKRYDLLRGLFLLMGLVRKKKKIPVDITFGKPIHIHNFLKKKGHKKTDLMELVVKKVFELRQQTHLKNKDDKSRSLDRYFSKK